MTKISTLTTKINGKSLYAHERAKVGGQPMKWDNPEKLSKMIVDYFEECKERKVAYTMPGLAVALGVATETIRNYARRDEFFSIIKQARQYVEQYANEYLMSGSPPVGALFLLKNHFGYKDRSEVEVNHKITMGNILAKVRGDEDVVDGEIVEEEEQKMIKNT